MRGGVEDAARRAVQRGSEGSGVEAAARRAVRRQRGERRPEAEGTETFGKGKTKRKLPLEIMAFVGGPLTPHKFGGPQTPFRQKPEVRLLETLLVILFSF
jgi:hypothetical protein